MGLFEAFDPVLKAGAAMPIEALVAVFGVEIDQGSHVRAGIAESMAACMMPILPRPTTAQGRESRDGAGCVIGNPFGRFWAGCPVPYHMVPVGGAVKLFDHRK